MTRPLSSSLTGILWMIVTGLCFVAFNGTVRYIGSDVPAPQAAFLRYVFGLVFLIPVLRTLLRTPLNGHLIRLYGFRGLAHSGAVVLWFFAMQRIPVAQATAIGYSTPIFVTIGAVLLFGERLGWSRSIALGVGFCGILVILRPFDGGVGIGQAAQLCSAPLLATSYLIAKQLTREATPGIIVAMLSLVCTVILLPGALLTWQPVTAPEAGWLALTALFATAGHYCMTRAMQAAPLTVIQPVTFLQLIWASLLGVAVFHEPLDPLVIAGGGIIIAAITFIAHREARMSRAIRTPAPPATKF